MPQAKYLGIDPGKAGAIACISSDGGVVVHETPVLTARGGTVYDIPRMVALLHSFIDSYAHPVTLGLEKVHSMPGQGVKSMFSMGEGYGIWQGLLVATGVPFMLVTPQAWKKVVLAGYGEKDKNAAYTVASQLYPTAKLKGPRGGLLDGNCDALCIAEHIRRMRRTQD